jgi:putative nucleotidyltransferase with HDIG domain
MHSLSLTEKEIALFKQIGQSADELGYPAYVVGGFVRDRIIGRATDRDVDVVCVGDGLELAKSVASKMKPEPEVHLFKRFGTAMIRSGEWEVEFVGARKESYSRNSRKPEVTPGSLQDDQNRRDFTINAMAMSLQEEEFGKLIDPFNGIEDLKDEKIVTPLEPQKTFSDDPLRMMRAVRFAAQLHFRIEAQTFNAIKEEASRLEIVSAERITTELQKIIATKQPSFGFKLLSKAKLLEEFFPEMEELRGVDVREGIGHKDNFYHTLEVLDNVAERTDNIWLRWAAILHDIAKPRTKRFSKESGWTFHGHDAVGAKMVPQIFKRLRLPLDSKMKYVKKLVRLHLRPISLTQEDISDTAVRRLIFEAGDDLEDLMLLCEADITSKNPRRVKRYLKNYEQLRQKIEEVEAKDRLRNWEPPISGDIIMETFDIPPSKEVGIIKTSIREAILDGDISNDYEEAYSFMLKKGKDLGLTPSDKK